MRNPHPTSIKEVLNRIRALGYPLELVPVKQWLQSLRQLQVDSDSVIQLLLTLNEQNITESELEPKTELEFDRKNADRALAGTDIVFPPTEQKLLETYFSYLIESGFLTAPSSSN